MSAVWRVYRALGKSWGSRSSEMKEKNETWPASSYRISLNLRKGSGWQSHLSTEDDDSEESMKTNITYHKQTQRLKRC